MDVKELLKRISDNDSSLKSLHLRWINIRPDDARILAEALIRNTTLHTLDLEWNCIWSDGACSLAEALMRNTTLRILRLKGNNIGSDGACALAEALMRNMTLKIIDLDRKFNINVADEVILLQALILIGFEAGGFSRLTVISIKVVHSYQYIYSWAYSLLH